MHCRRPGWSIARWSRAMLIVLSVLLIGLTRCASDTALLCDDDASILSICGDGLTTSARGPRNCRCDQLCPLYADCCSDYPQPAPATPNKSLRDVISCEVMKETFDATDGIYVVSLCPQNYTGNDDVRQACETGIYDDVIHQVPVSGRDSSLLYRNIYCAACHGEAIPLFWLVAMRNCGDGLSDDGCQVVFHPSKDVTRPPRTCLQDVDGCSKDGLNATLAGLCRRAAASFVTDGRNVFRNRYCALCNDIDEARLDCVQVPSLSSPPPEFDRSRFDAVYDLNAPQDTSRTCKDPAEVYDPLLSSCVPLPYCPASWSQCAGRRAARHATVDCPSALLAINSSDHIRYANGSVFVLSLQTLFGRDDCRYDNDTIYVCVPHHSLKFTVTLFRLNDVQRLISVVATVVGLLALVVLLSSYCLLTGCRRDNSSKMAICFVLCVLLYHVIYVVVLAGSRIQFIPSAHLRLASLCICAGVQYFAMTSFFWLHVLSIETFRAVRLWCTTDTPSLTSCTAFLVYSLYAWCVPGLIVGWSTALPLFRISGSLVVGESCCVLGLLQLLLFIVPIVVTLVINAVLYVLTALHLCRHSSRQYDTDTLLPDRHSPKVDTQWTTRSWSAERLHAERRATEAVTRRWNDVYVTCLQTSVLLATKWTFCLLPATGWIAWPSVLWYVYIALDLALMMTVCLSWCTVERVWYALATRKRDRQHDDDNDAGAAAAAAAGRAPGRGTGLVGSAGRRTPPAFNDSPSLRQLMRETSI